MKVHKLKIKLCLLSFLPSFYYLILMNSFLERVSITNLTGTSGFEHRNDKEYACQCRRCQRHGFNPWFRKTPWRRKWQPTPVFLPGNIHGQRSLEGYSPWGRKESDPTERLSTAQHTQLISSESLHEVSNLSLDFAVHTPQSL